LKGNIVHRWKNKATENQYDTSTPNTTNNSNKKRRIVQPQFGSKPTVTAGVEYQMPSVQLGSAPVELVGGTPAMRYRRNSIPL